jgi:hypothetical protein
MKISISLPRNIHSHPSFSFISRVLLAYMCFAAAIRCEVSSGATTSAVDQISSAPFFYEQLALIGDKWPGDAENEALVAAINTIRKAGVDAALSNLDKFVAQYPDSAWTPSLEANLARYHREHGRYTKALTYWEQAWKATRDLKDGAGKHIADFTFAHWTSLLASLGRTDTLRQLFAETQKRTFDAGPLQQVVNGAKEGFQMMLIEPGVCFKCGTLALENVARELKLTNFNTGYVRSLPSPVEGFTMTTLSDLAAKESLRLVPVAASKVESLVVPSIVHWKQEHYAAIIEEKAGRYRVVDPTFGTPRWLSLKDIQTEASGYFMVPQHKVPAGWRMLDKDETDKIRGRGLSRGISDANDGCGNGSGGSGDGCSTCSGSPSGNTGGNGAPCCPPDGAQGNNPNLAKALARKAAGLDGHAGASSPSAMPVWEVSEPYISTWLYDEPLGYSPGVGFPISFRLSYKQRESRPVPASIFNVGPMWNCS